MTIGPYVRYWNKTRSSLARSLGPVRSGSVESRLRVGASLLHLCRPNPGPLFFPFLRYLLQLGTTEKHNVIACSKVHGQSYMSYANVADANNVDNRSRAEANGANLLKFVRTAPLNIVISGQIERWFRISKFRVVSSARCVPRGIARGRLKRRLGGNFHSGPNW